MRFRAVSAIVLAFGLFACADKTDEQSKAQSSEALAGDSELASSDRSLRSTDGLSLTLVAEGLEFPWGLAQLPNGDLLVTEREGRLRLIDEADQVGAPISGLPVDIHVDGQAGLLGLLLARDFATSRTLYLSYVKRIGDLNATAVISAKLSADGAALTDVTEIFVGEAHDTLRHFGGRLAFYKDGTLLVGLGDGGNYASSAQNFSSLHGKLVRLNTDGSIPDDNPFTDDPTILHTIYSGGHRNIQGLIYDADRDIIFAHEHGPKGGDELNVVAPGKNYGWPLITYGVEYNGDIISELTEAPGLEQPLVKWVPSIAPSGLALVDTPGFEAWSNDLVLGAMNGPEGLKLVRVDLDEDGGVLGTHDLLKDLSIPFRDVISTPRGIYLATADLDGAVYQLHKER